MSNQTCPNGVDVSEFQAELLGIYRASKHKETCQRLEFLILSDSLSSLTKVSTETPNPWWSSYNLNRRQIVIISKLISNLAIIAAHLKRNNIIKNDNCECGDGASSPDHLIFASPPRALESRCQGRRMF